MVAASVRYIAFAVVLAAAAIVAAAGCRDRDRDRAGGSPGGSGSAGARAADEKIAWPAIDEQALIALQSTERFELGSPTPLAIAPDGAVLFRRSKPRDRVADLYQLDAAGKITLVAGATALLASKPDASIVAGAGIETIQLSDDGARILVPLADRVRCVPIRWLLKTM